MCLVPSVRRHVESLLEARKRGVKEVVATKGSLSGKLVDYCQRYGLLFGQYGALLNRHPRQYFSAYGLSRRGFSLFWQYSEEWKLVWGPLPVGAAYERFIETFQVKPRFCTPYVHALEVLSGVYGTVYQEANGHVVLGHYPMCPNNRLPSLYDLLAGWTILKPSKQEWCDDLPLSLAIRGAERVTA